MMHQSHATDGRRTQSGCRRRKGMALLAVMVLSVVGLMFIAVGQRYISAAISSEEHVASREDFDLGAIEAMSIALEQLERRAPSVSTYTCRVDVQTSAGVRSYAVDFQEISGSQWEVDVTPYSGVTLPEMPNLLP